MAETSLNRSDGLSHDIKVKDPTIASLHVCLLHPWEFGGIGDPFKSVQDIETF